MTHTFELPCYIYIGNKKIALNMNWYRNAHYMLLNASKRAYYPKGDIFKAEKISIAYRLVLNNNRRTDLMNWIAIADKYFLDVLVEMKCIPDDCAKHYASMSASCEVNTHAKESHIIAEVTVIE